MSVDWCRRRCIMPMVQSATVPRTVWLCRTVTYRPPLLSIIRVQSVSVCYEWTTAGLSRYSTLTTVKLRHPHQSDTTRLLVTVILVIRQLLWLCPTVQRRASLRSTAVALTWLLVSLIVWICQCWDRHGPCLASTLTTPYSHLLFSKNVLILCAVFKKNPLTFSSISSKVMRRFT